MLIRICLLIAALCLSSSCVPVLVGAGAASAASAGGGLYLTQRHGPDKALIEEILMVYQNDTRLQNKKLDVDAENGVVKIYGFVPTRQDEEYVMTVTGKVHGVKEVISRITILPPRLL
jgi:hypothetical protein